MSNPTRVQGLLLLFLIITSGYALYSLSNYNNIRSKQTVRVRNSFNITAVSVTKFSVSTNFDDDGMILQIRVVSSSDLFSHLVSLQNQTVLLDTLDNQLYQVLFENTDYFSEALTFTVRYGGDKVQKSVWVTQYNSLKYMLPHGLVVLGFLGLYLLAGKLNKKASE